MRKSIWREKANKVINKVFEQNPDANEQTIRWILRNAYPFGERNYHPYKIWCDAQEKALRRRFGVKALEVNEGLFKPL